MCNALQVAPKVDAKLSVTIDGVEAFVEDFVIRTIDVRCNDWRDYGPHFREITIGGHHFVPLPLKMEPYVPLEKPVPPAPVAATPEPPKWRETDDLPGWCDGGRAEVILHDGREIEGSIEIDDDGDNCIATFSDDKGIHYSFFEDIVFWRSVSTTLNQIYHRSTRPGCPYR